ncbi:hypothetical protein DRE_07369 [Drechslerella stenobrocha 248]|uniref:EamA domain-containing protein n=1 Tax=Drechslerella stenobrocha 248 TaxID=1043628 RepID=W7HIM8_9PEZI|nr:hypothetical protein DRE_07369 [Drechslerella stenobrocha 248]
MADIATAGASPAALPLLDRGQTERDNDAPEWEVEWDVYSTSTSASDDGSDDNDRDDISDGYDDGSPGLFGGGSGGSGSAGEARRQQRRRRVLAAAGLMIITVVSLVAQTECTVYVQRDLGWNKPYMILYLTHAFYLLLWPGLLVYERLRRLDRPWGRFFEDHFFEVRRMAQYVRYGTTELTAAQMGASPVGYILRTCFVQCCALNIAAATWFVAANMTTPSDLNAINNTSAIFTYVFSVWLLKEPVRMKKNVAVALAVIGVLIIAYGNPSAAAPAAEGSAPTGYPNRALGNIITGAGAVLFGLYRVMYKLRACLPAAATAEMNIAFSMIVGCSIGFFTTTVFWVPLPVLHIAGWERFEAPSAEAALWVGVGILCGLLFTTSFLTLISLTGPVLSSVAAMLSIFLVALYDWLFTGHNLTTATLAGGASIIVAFLLIGWSTYQETYRRSKRSDGYELERIPSREEDA